MIAKRIKRTLPLAALTVAMLAGAGSAQAATAPIKEIISSHIGWEVDATTKGGICTVESKNTCQRGKESSQPGGFIFPKGIAGTPSGNVYVADTNNDRVQELTAAGQFVLMFGREVNANKTNVCLAGETCQAGVEGSAPGQFGGLRNIAVDPGTGNVYVTERVEYPGPVNVFGQRVQEFTSAGVFVLEIGREVNETTKGNLCTQVEIGKGVKCKGPAPGAGSGEHGVFELEASGLAVGGPEDLVYAGDSSRVQEFTAGGEYKREIPVPAKSVAVDQAGDVYLVSEPNSPGSPIREYDPSGKEINRFSPANDVSIEGIALDPAGRLAVIENEPGQVNGTSKWHGLLYEVAATSLRLITEFADPGANAIAFNGKDELFATTVPNEFGSGHEVIAYKPVPVGELVVTAGVVTPGECVPGADRETDATLDCSLTGEVDPWGVSETKVWFQWGRTSALGEKTEPPIPVKSVKSEGEEETPVKVSAPIDGVRPNETFYDELVAEDHYVKAPELLTSTTVSFITPSVPPRILGEPTASFLKRSSAVLIGVLNPENANTRYEFQYAPVAACAALGEACPGISESTVLESSAYQEVPVALEVTGLQPATTYRYRLAAVNQVNGKTQAAVNETGGSVLPEGTFLTAPAPAVQAQTGGASAVTTTSAVLSGTVNPDGQPSVYTFELGVYNGASTRYGTVFSGPAGAGTTPAPQTLSVSGLQPGTTYAYRITIHFGDGTISGALATGATFTFTTEGLPAVLVLPTPLALLSVPPIAFPAAVTSKSTTKALTNAQKLAKALTACKKKARKQRAACQKQARKKYPKSKQANNRKKG
jgi:hypothetical protein